MSLVCRDICQYRLKAFQTHLNGLREFSILSYKLASTEIFQICYGWLSILKLHIRVGTHLPSIPIQYNENKRMPFPQDDVSTVEEAEVPTWNISIAFRIMSLAPTAP